MNVVKLERKLEVLQGLPENDKSFQEKNRTGQEMLLLSRVLLTSLDNLKTDFKLHHHLMVLQILTIINVILNAQ